MKLKRRVINFILSVVCCLCVFFCSSVVSSASEFEPKAGIFKYNGVDYIYTYQSEFVINDNKYVLSSPCYILCLSTGTSAGYVAISDVYFNLNLFGSDSYSYPDGFQDAYRIYTVSGVYTTDLIVNSVYSISDLIEAFSNYYISDDFDDLNKFIPDFNNYYHEDTDRWLNDLRAEVEDGTLYATWDGLAGEGLHVLEGYQNTYVQFHIQFINDKGTTSIADDEYTELFEFYTELSKNEFSISLSDFEVPEGYRLWCMWAEPYWYFNDDINSTMFKGKLSYLFFDENGVSDRPLIKDTGDIYNPLDPNLSNWNAITNFTGDYFYNMNNVMNSTFNSWDGSGMGSDNDKLGNALTGYSQHEEVIINQVSSNIRNFDFDNYLTFSDKVNAGISFGSMLINKFFVESGDFTILFVVGCIMVFLFVVVGIWRFSK